MFAVPGWAVSVNSLTTQRPSDTTGPGAKSSKKRKRKQGGRESGTQSVDGNLAVPTKLESNDLGAVQDEPSRPLKKRRQRVADRETGHDRSRRQSQGREDFPKRTMSEEFPSNVAPQASLSNEKSNPQLLGPPPADEKPSQLTALQTSMRDKLISSRFRYLNQTLYTTPSADSMKLFTENPAFFDEYHQGFRRQVAAWPENPVDGFVEWIRTRGAARPAKQPAAPQRKRGPDSQKGRSAASLPAADPSPGAGAAVEPLPRDGRTRTCTIADLGCGDAQLARVLTGDGTAPQAPLAKRLKLRLHSFDLAAASALVTVADLRALPLPDGSVDVAVFCLALMGPNWPEFVDEAWRVLRWKGECWVAEVGSRFAEPRALALAGGARKGKSFARGPARGRGAADAEAEEAPVVEVTSVPKAGPDVSAFVAVLRRRGFVLQGEADTSNKMFVRMRFVKAAHPQRAGVSTGRQWAQDADDDFSVEAASKVLKPCVYKTR